MDGNRLKKNGARGLAAAAALAVVLSAAALCRGQVQSLPPPRPAEEAPPPPTEGPPSVVTLPDLLRISLDANPALRQAALQVDVALGRATQAGLYPNPTIGVMGEELNHPGGVGGLISVPQLSQEFVTGGKLRLSRAVARKEVDQATLALLRERFDLYTMVRQGYFEVLAAQRRVEIYNDLVHLANQSYLTTQKLLKAGQVARLDLLQLEVERDRFRAEQAAAQHERIAAWKRLAANIGAPQLACATLTGALDADLPNYDYCVARDFILAEYPDVLSARVGIERAELALKRARAEPIPNVTVLGSYTRDNIVRGNEWRFEVGLPVPVFNRNQGNIRAAEAELGQANQQVARVANDLTARLAAAFGQYAAARERVERYRTSILPTARESYKLALQAYRGGQFAYLTVLQAQRTLAEANLSYNQALAEAWRAASQIAGFLLEEQWPPAPGAPCAVQPAPDPAPPNG
ncbi:MAG: TolC family protein [Gemmataceae bacterium]|nr:TolC family protein [Gemmataceae bacterium]